MCAFLHVVNLFAVVAVPDPEDGASVVVVVVVVLGVVLDGTALDNAEISEQISLLIDNNKGRTTVALQQPIIKI